MPFVDRHRPAWAWLLAIPITAPLLAPLHSAAAPSLCKTGETVAFSCTLAQRKVALCMQGAAGATSETGALVFRLGNIQPDGRQRVEQEYTATAQNGQNFFATVAPAMPGAVVRQLWFDDAGTRTLLTECLGRACRQSAGLAVLRGGRLISSRRCQRTPDDAAWFSGKLVKFGADADGSQSLTPLLRIEDIDNTIERIYPPQRR